MNLHNETDRRATIRAFTTACACAALLATATPAVAQTPFAATPFAFVGHIQKFRLVGNPGTNPLARAMLTVNGVDIVLPANLIVQMPASYLTPDDIFVMARPGITERLPTENCPGSAGTARSGLAVLDCDGAKPAAIASFEASVQGNVVAGTYVAGLVKITQQSLNSGSGYIQRIDRATGEILVGPDPDAVPGATVPAGSARLRINDSAGRYGRQTSSPDGPPTPALPEDGRFTADIDNPTIHAESGYPMCVPRGPDPDPECPDANRPTGAGDLPLRIFVMDSVPLQTTVPVSLTIAPCPGCDPARQAPFREGDHVTYSGTLAADAQGLYVSAHTIVASVGIYTKPGDTTRPAWLSQEMSLLGTIGPDVSPINQEGQDRLKVEAFSTDPGRDIHIYAIDVNAADGSKRLRFLGRPNKVQGALGRYRLILGKRAGALTSGGTTFGAPRELVVTFAPANGIPLNGQPPPSSPTAANGLVAGQYTAPVGEFIFPENTVTGEPRVPNNFECLGFLQRGSGPLTTRNRSPGTGPATPVVGRLNPWPGAATAPTTVFCGP